MANLHLKPWTDQRLTMAMGHTGKKSGQLGGSYISDLVSLKKCITLCVGCSRKFSAASNGYVTDRSIPKCSASCDGCKDMGHDRNVYVHHQNMPKL
jgi:hypothetical protein